MSAHSSTATPFHVPRQRTVPHRGTMLPQDSSTVFPCPRTAIFYLWAVMAVAIATPVTAIAFLCLVGS